MEDIKVYQFGKLLTTINGKYLACFRPQVKIKTWAIEFVEHKE